MPVYLRNFYYNKLLDTRKEENESIKKQQKQPNKNISQLNIPRNPRFKQ